jgi:hypothetical protein
LRKIEESARRVRSPAPRSANLVSPPYSTDVPFSLKCAQQAKSGQQFGQQFAAMPRQGDHSTGGHSPLSAFPPVGSTTAVAVILFIVGCMKQS